MRKLLVSALSVTVISLATCDRSSAQNAAVAQMYGKGVHAYYAGNHTAARDFLSMAINHGSNDPRAYYFRGLVAFSQGNAYAAESDWQQGARLEAQGKSNPYVGRSLTRFQGTGRLKLEEIRQKARLEYAAIQAVRSNQNSRAVGNSTNRNSVTNPQPTPPPPTMIPGEAAPPEKRAASPALEDPFADNLADGEARVTEEDALEGSMDAPFADEPAASGDAADAPAADDAGDPFAGGDDASGDLFGDSEPGAGADAADDSDPFADSGDDSDPFAE